MILNSSGPFPLDRRGMALAVWRERRRIVEAWKHDEPNDDEEADRQQRAWAAYAEAVEELSAANFNQ